MKYTRAMTLSKGWKDMTDEMNHIEPLLGEDQEKIEEQKQKPSNLSWLYETIMADEDKVQDLAGFDSLMYLKFVKYCAILFIVLFIGAGSILEKFYYDLSYDKKCYTEKAQKENFTSTVFRLSLRSF